jgi:hypothetical protein
MYMRNADCNKYGILFNELSSQFSLGQDQYPKTILDANNVLSNDQFDAAYIENRKKRKDKERSMTAQQ